MSRIVFTYYPRTIFLYFHTSIVDAGLNFDAPLNFWLAGVTSFFLLTVGYPRFGVDRVSRLALQLLLDTGCAPKAKVAVLQPLSAKLEILKRNAPTVAPLVQILIETVRSLIPSHSGISESI